MTDYPGIDYGLGKTNIDKHGIRYGVIPINSLPGEVIDEFELNYSQHCPYCGYELDEDNWNSYGSVEPCSACGELIEDGEQYGDEPDSQTYDDGELKMEIDSSYDVWIFKSPVVTNCQYCSPCAPGAGYLLNPCDDGPLTYAIPSDWFDEYCPCPYRTSPAPQTKVM